MKLLPALISLIAAFPLWIQAETNLLLGKEILSLEHQTEELYYYQVQWSQNLMAWAESRMPQFLGTGGLDRVDTLLRTSAIDGRTVFFRIFRENSIKNFDPNNHPPMLKTAYTPSYPVELWRDGVEGDVTALFIITSDGSVKDIEIEHSTDERFNSEVLYVLQFWKFMPYTVNGEKLAVRVRQPIPFRIIESSQPFAGGDATR